MFKTFLIISVDFQVAIDIERDTMLKLLQSVSYYFFRFHFSKKRAEGIRQVADEAEMEEKIKPPNAPTNESKQ